MKKLKYALLLGSFVITTALSGCGDGNFTSLKESSMYYSDTQNKILLKKVDGAPKVGDALEKAIPNGKWENEEKKYDDKKEDYIVYKGTLKTDEVKAIKDNIDHHDQALNALRSTPIKDLPSRFECDLDGNEYVVKFYFKEVDKDNFIPDSMEILGDEKAGYDKTSLDPDFVLMELLEKANPEYDFQKDGIPLIYIPKALQEAEEKIQNLQKVDKIVGQIYPDKVREIMENLDEVIASTIKDDQDYSNSNFKNQKMIADAIKAIDDSQKIISDTDFGDSKVKEMLMAVLDKEKGLIDQAKDISQKRNNFKLPKDKNAFMNNVREDALKFDKDCKEISKMCGGGKIVYDGTLNFSGGLDPVYEGWHKKNLADIEKIKEQVWQQ